MEYRTQKQIVGEDGQIFVVGDTVSIDFKGGSGFGCCEITKITDTGFHISGKRRDKSIQYKDVERLKRYGTINNQT